MASGSPDSSSPFHQRDFSFLLPLMFTLSVPTRSIIINPFTQTMLVVSGGGGDDLPDDAKLGRPPASKESIKEMESVVICEGDEDQCVVCLEEWGAGDVARVMPCKHRFHGDCIEKWLGVHGSCPVCRHEMPPEEVEDDGKKREEDGRGGRGSGVLVFSINFGGILGGAGSEINSGERGEPADSSAATASGQE